jgi:hypothetical protein
MSGRTGWCEFIGGPSDGEMFEWDRPLDEGEYVTVTDPVILRPDWTLENGPVLGFYQVRGWADRDLGIVRCVWEPASEAA